MYQLRNFKTKEIVEPKNFVFTSDDSPWEVVMDLEQIKSKLNIDYFKKAPPFHSKYLPFMPIEDYASFVSLKEGATPLIKSKRLGDELGIDLQFKLESQNPTGSFKDRGSAVELTLAKQFGAEAITVASTGNMAASCSCYAASAGIPCFIFVPEGTPNSKLSQSIAYGGRIVQVKGSYADAAALAETVAEELGFYLAGDYAFRVEGQKTAAFELVDQLFYRTPDMVVIPMGCGTNMTGYYKGFSEYKELGFISRIPKLIGVQPSGAPSIIQSFDRKQKDVSKLERVDSIATAISVNYALDGAKALDAIYQTEGEGISVSDNEMLEAQYELAKKEGLFVETSCASTLAALKKLNKNGELKGKQIVLVLTGAGLKDPNPILKVAIKPPTLFPNIADFMSLYNNSFFSGKTIALTNKDEIIFDKEPGLEEIKKAAVAYLNAHYSDEHLEMIKNLIRQFLKKGKPITFADFQDTIQDALETITNNTKSIIQVKSFTASTAKDEVAKAKVVVELEGQELTGEANGTGPVDAVLNAIAASCAEKISYELDKYKVNVRGSGTDAVVYVELKLRKNASSSIGTGASPDIIQASIEAFEKAYNGFYS